MKIQIESLKAQMQGRELNIYQKAEALIEFNKLLDYVEELEQLTIHSDEKQRELLLAAICEYNKFNTQKDIKEVDDWLEKWVNK